MADEQNALAVRISPEMEARFCGRDEQGVLDGRAVLNEDYNRKAGNRRLFVRPNPEPTVTPRFCLS